MDLSSQCLTEPSWQDQPEDHDPMALFDDWLLEASRTETADVTAMTLATATPCGRPSARIVLMKGRVDRSFVFYSSRLSRKGQELRSNAWAALMFYWPNSRRQIRIEGRIGLLDDGRSDAYFAARYRGSQLGSWASRQSADLSSRADLVAAVEAADTLFADGAVPRPPHWGGFTIEADTIEFWEAGLYRLNHRRRFSREDERWITSRLFP